MNRLILLISFFIATTSCGHGQPENKSQIIPGAYQLADYLPLLKDKNVALVVNHTSMVGPSHLVDTLLSLNVNLKKVFAPEHGFRGDADAGETVKSGVDVQTKLSIISLYGDNKKPTAKQLAGIDVVVFDIQDVGTRFYTYISTMHYMMEACAESNKPMIILDRPNPNGMYVDGPVLKPAYQSFVGMHPIPVLHGLTVGELAKMINGEGWLNNKIKCGITIIPVENYNHKNQYSLPVKPSPNLPNDLSIKMYPSLCLFEGTVISVGRGTYQPFQQIGHPDFKDLPHVFTPESIEGMAKNPRYENQKCYGIDFHQTDFGGGFSLAYLLDFYQKYEEKDFFNSYFDKLAGTDELRKQITNGLSEEDIREGWAGELNSYKVLRRKYLLYEDFE
ncbi:DUF1343 domain-containing protein [Fulvivirga ulvae]|uniref:exo-beta-N-acetylmuramidase NamZ family protein n=1 Tax=Fulvivirga ulvae TaxID=2904245 RepID=UPI001F3CF67F|nr:DUF1343 domain-containing protein [Fulvivirga ulvae]UII29916.1 DUF1343 domain-containing protein [Fulvivirga ulvae]